MKTCLLLFIVFVVIFIVFVINRKNKKEGFAIVERNYAGCQNGVDGEKDLTPNAIQFVVENYNYQSVPRILRNEEEVTALQTFWDWKNMTYYLTVFAPTGLRGSTWHVVTTDDVEPTISEGFSREKLRVKLDPESRDGTLLWRVI